MKKNKSYNYFFMRFTKLFNISFLLFGLCGNSLAQDTTNLMNKLEKEEVSNKTVLTTSTFKYTRIVDGHSVENLSAHTLDVRISHRFGPLNSGAYNFFGLDIHPANVRIGFDYGITNNLMIGIGHSGAQKTYDAFSKIKILSQSSGVVNMPISLSFVPTIAINTLRHQDFIVKLDSAVKVKRVSYVFQLLIARKFSEEFSLQIMSTFIHPDNISFDNHINDHGIFAVGIAGRQKISKRMSVNAEYYYQLPGTKETLNARNVFSIGIDIGTGGHVFQLHFTNSNGLTEKSFIAENTGRWSKGDEMFGFNISRVFQLNKKHH